MDFVTFVSEHSFNEEQLQGYEAFIDAQNTANLKKHMNFMNDVSKITDELIPEEGTTSQSSNNTVRYVNRSDLA